MVQRFQEYKFPLVAIILLASVLHLLFITLDFFPHKYSLIAANHSEHQLVLEKGIFDKQTFLLEMDNELQTALLEIHLEGIDGLLFILAIFLAAIIVITVCLFQKEKKKEPYLIALAICAPPFIYFFVQYYQAIGHIDKLI